MDDQIYNEGVKAKLFYVLLVHIHSLYRMGTTVSLLSYKVCESSEKVGAYTRDVGLNVSGDESIIIQ